MDSEVNQPSPFSGKTQSEWICAAEKFLLQSFSTNWRWTSHRPIVGWPHPHTCSKGWWQFRSWCEYTIYKILAECRNVTLEVPANIHSFNLRSSTTSSKTPLALVEEQNRRFKVLTWLLSTCREDAITASRAMWSTCTSATSFRDLDLGATQSPGISREIFQICQIFTFLSWRGIG